MKVIEEKIKFWSLNGFNFYLEGHAGVGKSAMIKGVWNQIFKKWKYFSVPTIDPYIEVKGIPRQSKKSGYLEFIKPDWHEDVEAIFFDELGRGSRVIRNALLELTQDHSINGVKLPNLKVIGAASNPCDDEGTYDVERLDPAQAGRFKVRYEIPYEINQEYFATKYDPEIAKNVCSWWNEIPDFSVKLKTQPRQVDYALEVYMAGGDLRDSLPKESGLDKLQQYLNSGPAYFKLKALLKAGDPEPIRAFLKIENNYASCIPHIRKDNKVLKQVLPLLQPEKLASVMAEDKKIKDAVVNNPDQFPEQFCTLMAPNVSEDFYKTVQKKLTDDAYCEKLYKSTGLKSINNFYIVKPGEKFDEFPREKAEKLSKKFDLAKADKLFEEKSVKVAIEYNIEQKSEFYKKEFLPLLTAPGVAGQAELKRLMSLFCISLCNLEVEELNRLEEMFPDCVAISNYMFQLAREANVLDPLIKEHYGSALMLIADLDWTELGARLNLTGVPNGHKQTF